MSQREVVAHALLDLIGKGPNDTFPFPTEEYNKALVVVDEIAKLGDGSE